MVAIQSLFSAIAATGFASLAQAAPHTSLATRASAFQAGKINYTIKEIQDTFMPSSAALKDKCVFYWSYFHTKAENYAHANGKVIVNDVYYSEGHQYYPFDQTKDPMLSYTKMSETGYRVWFNITSAAYADLCTGTVELMWDGVQKFSGKTESGKDWQSIWLTGELPQLRSKATPISNVVIIPTSSPFTQQKYPGNWKVAGQDDPSASVDHVPDELKKRSSGTSQVVAPTENTDLDPAGTTFGDSEEGWVAGNCSIYLVQKQDTNVFQGNIYDAENHKLPANVDSAKSTGNTMVANSTLPWELNVTFGSNNTAPVQFKYDQETWDSDDENCQVGDYADNERPILCTFDCTW